ncbi:Mediator of RNA polymerase II transcription subunit 15a [Linum perenne]
MRRMDGNNWRPAAPGGEAAMDSGDWRATLQADSRQRIVNKIMETLERHLPSSGQVGLQDLKNVAVRFEEKIYAAATSQSDYLRKISMKMHTVESRSQNSLPNSLPPSNPPDQGASPSMQSQVPSQGQSLPIPWPANQQVSTQNMKNNMNSTGLQSSATLQSSLPPVSGMNQTPINVAGQNASMQNVSNIAQNQSQGVSSNMFGNPHRQMPGRNQVVGQQQQQQSQNPQQYHYQQQLLLKQRNVAHPMMQSQLQQQPQQNGMQPSQFQQQQHQPPQQQQQPMYSQQQLMGQQANAAIMQKNQFAGQHNNIGDLQQQKRLLNQQTNHQSQQQQQQQQQMMDQQNNLSGLHQQKLGSQSNFSGLQQPAQQQLVGTQAGNSSMQNNQHAVNMLQKSKGPLRQQPQQNSSNLLPAQGQPTQSLASQQQLMSKIQSHPGQMQQQLGLQQPTTSLQREMQQRLQASGQAPGSLVQPQNVVDQQKQLYQSQRALPEISSASLDSTAQTGQTNGVDWQEELYQKIKALKEMYLPELNELLIKIATKLQQHDSLPQPPKSDQLEKLKMIKTTLEHMINFIQVPKENVIPSFKDRLGSCEKQILSFLTMNRPKKPMPPMQQGQLPPSHMQSLQQPLLQNPSSTSQQANINSISSQNGMTMLQQGHHLQSNPNMLQQQQHMKQQQDQQILQSHQFKQQLHQRQMLQQQQQRQQYQNQQVKQQNQQAQQMPQLHQMNDVNDIKIRQGLGGVKPGVYQQHLSTGQRGGYPQQIKSGASFPVSSPQMLQTPSPQSLQHSSPQVEQQNLLPSLSRTGTPLQPAHSPFVAPSPSTSMAPSPLPGDEKSGMSSLSNAGNVGHQHPTSGQAPAQSLAIGNPGISASPLLAEFSVPEGAHGNAFTTVSGKPTVAEQPFDRLIKAVKSLSPKALNAAVGDIGSVVSMMDRIAGSVPGNGSRAAVGEDLAAMTNCRLQARDFITQDGISGTRKRTRYTSAMSLNVVTSAGDASDSKQWNEPETFDRESTATFGAKRPRLEANHALMEEIREINERLIDTVIDISDEDANPSGEGTIVKCSYSAVALSPNLKSQYASAQMTPIEPLRLLVPVNYPECSPIVLDSSKEKEDMAKRRLSSSLRSVTEAMSIGEIARRWDICARTVISEHAQQQSGGGGSFSTKYGTWEKYLTAA